jgi:hypothetical protein
MSEHSPQTSNTTSDDDLANDKLEGAIEIAKFRREKPHRTYYLFSRGRLAGVYKDGNRLIGSKSAIRRAHHNRARSGK